jgi:hypothetical protein
MDNQINDMSKGDKTNGSPNKYNLRSKKKEGNMTSLISLPEHKGLLKM